MRSAFPWPFFCSLRKPGLPHILEPCTQVLSLRVAGPASLQMFSEQRKSLMRPLIALFYKYLGVRGNIFCKRFMHNGR